MKQKPGFFVVRAKCYTARKTHKIRGFWHFLTIYEKNLNLDTERQFLVSGVQRKQDRLLSTKNIWPYNNVVRITAGRGRVIPRKMKERTMWPRNNNTGEIGVRSQVYPGIGSGNQWNFGGVSKNHAAEVGLFDSGFLECLVREKLPSNFATKCTRMRERKEFFVCQCKRHYVPCVLLLWIVRLNETWSWVNGEGQKCWEILRFHTALPSTIYEENMTRWRVQIELNCERQRGKNTQTLLCQRKMRCKFMGKKSCREESKESKIGVKAVHDYRPLDNAIKHLWGKKHMFRIFCFRIFKKVKIVCQWKIIKCWER